MSSDLQEMDNVVKKGAAASQGMDTSLAGKVDDLGGPTPENYRSTDDSAKLKDPAAIMAKAPQPKAKAEETEVEEPVVAEAETPVTEDQLPEINVEEDVAALFAGEELSEEFQEKAKTVFEAAVTARVTEAKAQIEEQAQASLVEELEELKSALTERVDAYLEYVAQEWIEENALQIEHGLKTEMTESFLQGMKGLFENHYVSIPEDKYDVVENMVNKLDDMEVKLNEQIERNINLNRRLGETTAEGIFGQVSEGLALTQKDKLASLVEGVEFEGEESYREKLTTLRESYFPAEMKSETSETLSEGVDSGRDVTNSMSRYLETLSRIK